MSVGDFIQGGGAGSTYLRIRDVVDEPLYGPGPGRFSTQGVQADYKEADPEDSGWKFRVPPPPCRRRRRRRGWRRWMNIFGGGRIRLRSTLRRDQLWNSLRKRCGDWGCGPQKGGGTIRNLTWREHGRQQRRRRHNQRMRKIHRRQREKWR